MTIEELRAELEKRLRARRHDQYALYVGAATGIGYEAASQLSRADLNRRFVEDDYENFDRLNAEELEGFEQDNGYINALEEVLALLAPVTA